MGGLDLFGGEAGAVLDAEAVLAKLDKGALGGAADRDGDLALVLFAVLHALGLERVEATLGLVHGRGEGADRGGEGGGGVEGGPDRAMGRGGGTVVGQWC